MEGTSTVSLPTAGSTSFFVHVAAEDGYSTNDADGAVENANFSVRRDADVRVKEVTISWSGDRIELDRDELGLDPDGETDPVTGTTTLRYTLDEGDNGAAVPTALTLEVAGMNADFGEVTFAVLTDDPPNSGTFPACPDEITTEAGDITVEANATGTETTGKGEAGICFRITDSDGAAPDPDAHDDNTRDYRLILTRK